MRYFIFNNFVIDMENFSVLFSHGDNKIIKLRCGAEVRLTTESTEAFLAFVKAQNNRDKDVRI